MVQSIDPNRPFHCDKCGKNFKSVGALKGHDLNFHSAFRCFQCGRCFRNTKDLNTHESQHTGKCHNYPKS